MKVRVMILFRSSSSTITWTIHTIQPADATDTTTEAAVGVYGRQIGFVKGENGVFRSDSRGVGFVGFGGCEGGVVLAVCEEGDGESEDCAYCYVLPVV